MDYATVYNKMFARSDYNIHPASEPRYAWAISKIVKTNPKISLLDVGSGRGSFIKLASLFADTTAMDLENFHNLPIRHINCDIANMEKFSQVVEDIKKDVSYYDYVTCLDVLEHIEEAKIDGVLEALSRLGVHYLFAISNHSDVLDGVELHLTQKPLGWWKERLSKFYHILSTKTEYSERAMFFHCKTKHSMEF